MKRLGVCLFDSTLRIVPFVRAEDFASPADFGVAEFVCKVSETDFYIKHIHAKALVNEKEHRSGVSRVDTQQVIRET